MNKKSKVLDFVSNDKQEWSQATEHGHSYCVARHDPLRFLICVDIPKNASSWVKHHTPGMGFNYHTQKFSADNDLRMQNIDTLTLNNALQHARYIVILRDPVNRWISGLAQYLHGYDSSHPLHINNVDWDMIFDTVVFDGHTRSQCKFIKGIDHSKIIWLRCDNTLAKNYGTIMEQFTGTPFKITTEDQDPNNVFNITKKKLPAVMGSLTNPGTFTTELPQFIVDRISEKLADNPDYFDKLRHFYKKDYELFDTVNFYQA
jgi:hypothetical protein